MTRSFYLLFILCLCQINYGQSEEYIVGGDFDYPPFSYIDKNGNASGLDIDVLNAISEVTGITLNYQLSQWDSALNYIQSGKTDIIAAIIFSEEREDFLDYTYPIHTEYYSVFIRKDLPFNGISDLYDYKLMVLHEDVSIDKFLIPMGLYEDHIAAKSLPEAIAGIEWGRADYVIAPYSLGMNEIANNKYENIVVKGPAIIPSIYCLAVKKGNTHLLGVLNKGISALRARGELKKIKSKWLVYERNEMKYWRIAKNIGIIFSVATILFILVSVWVWQLRIQIARNTKNINKKNQELKRLNAEKDKLFTIIAHDLKSPFNSMLGFSRMLLDGFDEYDKEKKKHFISIIHKRLENTFELLENLLYWSRTHAGGIDFKPQKINLFALCNTIKELLIQSADNKSINVISQIPEDIYVEADKDMLSTIIRNLITNAIKFTPREGEIVIKATRIKENKFVEIIVADNGVGISKEIQSKLFNIEENISMNGTENESGTGLGLLLCKEFVEKHKGNIYVESEPGRGSEFKFTIPF